MLILIKTSIKTSFLAFLFILGSQSLLAGNTTGSCGDKDRFEIQTSDLQYNFNFSDTNFSAGNDTLVPPRLLRETIEFQVNSEIVYLKINHFVKSEAKKMFVKAWLGEQELKHLAMQTDSLRKLYSNLPEEKKTEISDLILKNEDRSNLLNQEIQALYQNARNEEDRYWQSASKDEIASFQQKINLLKDSILNAGNVAHVVPDTIILYKHTKAAKPQEVKVEPVSGVIYKIQIGAYKGKVPESANKLMKKLSVIRKIENHIDEKGVTVYTTGNLKTWQEAVTMQNQVKQEGVKNATVVAYQNAKKITVNEARKINNEL